MEDLPTVTVPCALVSRPTNRQSLRQPDMTAMAEQEIVLLDASHPDRDKAEAMVRRVFQQSYGARLSAFYPWMLGIRGKDGEFRAIAGIRTGSQRFFAEHYLPDRVEKLLGVPREEVVEVGNLATRKSGEIRWIIAAVTAFLQGAGFSRVLITITPLLRNSFRRMGLPLEHLADARQESLPAELAGDWGAYYDCNPEVCVGKIAIGYHAFRKNICSSEQLRQAWEQALVLGETRGPCLRDQSE